MPRPQTRPRIIAYTTLNAKRVHVKACVSYGTDKDCPSKSKKKCPLWAFGFGRDEGGNLVRVRESLKMNDLKKALEKIDNLLLGKSTLNPREFPPSVEETIEKFFAEQTARHMSESTILSFRKFLTSTKERDLSKHSPTLSQFARAKGLVYISQFTPALVSEFRAEWKVSTITSAKQTERLKSFFGFCSDMGWIKTNPAAAMRLPVVNENDDVPVIPFRKREEERVFKALGEDPRMLVLNQIMRYTGLAIADAVQLRPERLDGDHLKLRRTKTGAWVKVLLPPWLAKDLRGLSLYAAGYWFWNRQTKSNHQTATGNTRRKLRKVFGPDGANIALRDDDGNPIKDRTGKQLYGHPHMWRHTFVKSLIQSGASIPAIAELIGDAPKTVQEHYKEFIAENQQSLDRVVKKMW